MLETLLNTLTHETTRQTLIHECSHCGTTLDSRNDSCPYCEDARVVTFEL